MRLKRKYLNGKIDTKDDVISHFRPRQMDIRIIKAELSW